MSHLRNAELLELFYEEGLEMGLTSSEAQLYAENRLYDS